MRHLRSVLLIALIFVPILTVCAAEKFEPKAVAETIDPYLDGQTIVVGRIDVSRINVQALLDLYTKIIPAEKRHPAEQVTLFRRQFDQWIAGLQKAGASDVYISGQPGRCAKELSLRHRARGTGG